MSTPDEEEIKLLVPKHGIPTPPRDNREPREKKLAVYIILLSTLFERMAFYTLAANLALTLEPVKVEKNSPSSSITPFIFFGTSYVSSIIFAIISDWKLGRAKTIIFGFILYILGFASAIILIALPHPNCKKYLLTMACTANGEADCKLCTGWIIATLVIIAIGAGAVEANMAVLLADQIQDSKFRSRVFDNYMIAVNIGGIIATGAFLFVSKSQTDETKRYLYPCIVAISALTVATILIVIGYRYYLDATTHETVVTSCIPVLINAAYSWYVNKKGRSSKNNEDSDNIDLNVVNASKNTIERDHSPPTFLDFAKLPFGKFQDRIVDEVKSLRGPIIVFTILIVYWTIYNQLSTTFSLQAKYMKGSNDYTTACVWLGDPVTIIVGILLSKVFVYKFLDTRHPSVTITIKFVIGMSLACFTMCIAGSVEVLRQEGCKSNDGQKLSSVHILFQLPQNIFMGLSEVFAMVASLEYSCLSASRSAESLFMSLRFFSVGISSFVATGYFATFSSFSSGLDFSCEPKKDRQWPFYTYFFILGGLQFIFIIIFIVCQRKFEIIKLSPQQMETHQFQRHLSTSSASRQ